MLLEKRKIKRNLPESPGVYIFKDETGKPIYIGKARNLKNRVASYFTGTLEGKTSRMIEEAEDLSFMKVSSEFEAILLEAVLVKKHLPKFNSQLRDDKTPLYIGITKETLPRVLTFRKTQLKLEDLAKVYGPFTSSSTVRTVLQLVRRAFPFSQHKPSGRVCIYSQIGLCNPCPSKIMKSKTEAEKRELAKAYKQNILNVKKVLSGKGNLVQKNLEKKMKDYAKTEKFEKAQKIKEQLELLDLISKPYISSSMYLKDPNLVEDIRKKEIRDLREKILPYLRIKSLRRIECFDVAHLAGTNPTASMVTFINGEPDKSFYRHFKIYIRNTRSDTDMMKSVIERRQLHWQDWGTPDLIIVDGGRGQISAAKSASLTVPVIGLAKGRETLIFKTEKGFERLPLPESPAKALVQRLRDEAHRFARKHHHNLVAKSFKSSHT